ncbi:type I-F CRISPR-associated protein Csy1 [Pseudobacteriovorax antillogorgiicola]|uniref:CRISPR-associated protein, Csy1 family n=1 Tax=Pseudobacteriovorax antillogorgiicola TaxID=1513793 RepID=A0A1Y6C9N8_9BACT|nr:type I-F CRISPR-associated protein Csy1 [Pseudobacteriovorax antillogorgiicola]TCS49877.1 CRISPR-associated Csy1 family protein [Pseudobacteriovorax antillogorgiicola]SMF44330.1 CRISPR-associated protein, Csy1 family [Pseudobacteriovorax antillogorgiicola]
MHEAIESFFEKRKEERLKKKSKEEVEEEFDLNNWLPSAAARAKQIALSSHPCTFSHPSAKASSAGRTTAIIAESSKRDDGFVRTGNLDVSLDALGNAAALDVHSFLNLQMGDGRSLLTHIEDRSEIAKDLLKIPSASFDNLRNGFLEMKSISSDIAITNSKIKQVYFPVDNSYHLLSVLRPSPILYEMKRRIDAIKFSDVAKEAREAKKRNEAHDKGFIDLFNLTVIGYGGTKPQNISVQNKNNGGKAYLLPSLPPSVRTRPDRLPKKDFFRESISPWQFKDDFKSFHLQVIQNNNGFRTRSVRDENFILHIFDQVITDIYRLREDDVWQTVSKSGVPHYQRVFLDNKFSEERDDELRETFFLEFSRWFIRSYRKILGSRACDLGDEDLRHISKLIRTRRRFALR